MNLYFAQTVRITTKRGDLGSNPGGEDPWRREWQPTPAFFLEIPWTGAW